MGWERKRGKLHELNALLRGSTTTDILTTGRPRPMPPAGRSLRRHPRRRHPAAAGRRGAARRDDRPPAQPAASRRRDRAGHRRATGSSSRGSRRRSRREREASLYQRIFSGSAGIDPYASAVSDVYQDLFGEGSYTGKGIYDLDAFERALAGRVPENTLLSHDLFEGTFARAGLVTDIELFDEYPSHYLESAARQHRWARGDWQLLPWILGRARDATGRPGRSPLPGIARWKMVDNLRRTLSPPLALATLVGAWTLPSVPVGVWTGFVLAAIIVPAALPVLGGLLPRRRGISKRSHLRAVASDVGARRRPRRPGPDLPRPPGGAHGRRHRCARWHACWITRRGLLEWTTASQTKASRDPGPGRLLPPDGRRRRRSRPSSGRSSLAVQARGAALVAAPFVLLWLASPLIARWVSLPPAELGRAAAVGGGRPRRSGSRPAGRGDSSSDSWAPRITPCRPTTSRRSPQPVVAHRTSPTNIGMYLLTTSRPATSAGSARSTWSSGSRRRSPRSPTCRGSTATSTTGTTPATSARSSRPTCRRSTAATCARRCSCPGERVPRDGSTGRCPSRSPSPASATPSAWRGEAAAAIGDERRTQTVTRRQLGRGASSRSAGVTEDPAARGAWAAQLAGARRPRPDPRRRRGGPHRRAGRRPRQRARGVGRGGRGDDREPRPGPRDAATPTTTRRPRSASAAGSWRSPTRPSGSSTRRTSASSSIPTRKLFSIGYRVSDGVLDPSYYDLLASEARLASFLAIAKGDVAPEHWFRLGRALTPVGRELGPHLVVRVDVRVPHAGARHARPAPEPARPDVPARRRPPDELRGGARGAVGHLRVGLQRARPGPDLPVLELRRAGPRPEARPERGRRRRALRDRARGDDRPRGGGAELRPPERRRGKRAVRLPRGARLHARGGCPRAPPSRSSTATWPTTRGWPSSPSATSSTTTSWSSRFHADPIVQATELLLQERMPRDVLVARPRAEEVKSAADVRDLVPPVVRRFTSPHDLTPRTHLLSNGRYAVMVTAAGSGYSRWRQPRRDPLARGLDARLVGQLPVPPRHAVRGGLVGRPPAERRRGRQLRGPLLGGARRVRAVATARSRPA